MVGGQVTQSSTMKSLGCLHWVNVDFGYPGAKGVNLFDRLSFEICGGEFVALLGRSGCGKTTMLRLSGGILPPSGGQVLLEGQPVGLGDPRIGFVFQEHSLHPWRTVEQNVELPLLARGMAPQVRKDLLEQVLERVQLSAHSTKYPHELSGGMKQRTAIARVLATDATYLLMDEPFGALDSHTRSQMQDFLREIWLADRKTTLLVTHSVEEALLLSSRILLLQPQPYGQSRLLDIPVDLPHPRDVGDPQFQRLRKELLGQLKV